MTITRLPPQTRRVCDCGCGVYLRSTNPDSMTSYCREREDRETGPLPEIKDTSRFTVRYSREDMIRELKLAAEELGRTPSVDDFKSRRPTYSTYMSRFGTWSNAIRAAGLDPRPFGEKIEGIVPMTVHRRDLLEAMAHRPITAREAATITNRSINAVRKVLAAMAASGLCERYEVPVDHNNQPRVYYRMIQEAR